MKKLRYTIDISAPAKAVHDTMLGLSNKETYEQWTSTFNPTSTYEGNWETGSKMYFVGTDDKGNRGGMVSEIAEHEPGRFVSIRHYGILNGDEEITEGKEVDSWAGGLENYAFDEQNGVTTVTAECDVNEEHLGYFDETWPKALRKLKDIVEAL